MQVFIRGGRNSVKYGTCSRLLSSHMTLCEAFLFGNIGVVLSDLKACITPRVLRSSWIDVFAVLQRYRLKTLIAYASVELLLAVPVCFAFFFIYFLLELCTYFVKAFLSSFSSVLIMTPST